jgi:hypothetical protein
MSKKKTNDEPELPESKSETESPEQQNIYEFQMSSTETALISPDDFWKIKLAS